MSSHAVVEPTGRSGLDPAPVNVRTKIAALWTSMLFVFAYVDLFSLYRPDVRADIEAGKISDFTIGRPFLLGTTIYVVIPSLMVVASLVAPAALARIANVVLSVVYALTIIAGAIGEWSYYVVGSLVEVVLLMAAAHLAWRWPPLATFAPDRETSAAGDGG